MLRIDNTLYNIYDQYTGEEITYNKVTDWIDGSPMSDLHCDGVIFRKLGTEYFKRNYSGSVNPLWWGADPEGINDSTPAFQAAIDAFQTTTGLNSGVDILIPRGTYLLGDLMIKTGTKLYANQSTKDNFISNVPVTIKPAGNPDYIIDCDPAASNWAIENLYLDCDYTNQPQLIAGIRTRGTKAYLLGNNINKAPGHAVFNAAGLIFIEKNSILGMFAPNYTFTGINDFKGALHMDSIGDSYVFDNEISASLPYFTSTVTPRDPVNGRIVAMAFGGIFSGTSVVSGNLFENGDRAVAIGNSLYCNWHNNRYELSALGGLYIYGPTQFASFSQERFADNSLTTDGGADDITIAIGAAGNIAFIAPTFESLANVSIPNSSFQVNYHISNYGSDLVDLVTPLVDPTYAVNGLINLSGPTLLPVRQVKGQYDPDNPKFESVSTQKLPAEVPQVGYVKMKRGTDEDNQSLVGAVEFWTPQDTLAYSIGFSPKEYLSISGYEPNPIFAFNGNIALQKTGEAKCTIWSSDGLGNSQIVLQGGALVTSQATITLDNSTEDLTILSSNDVVIGLNENFRFANNGLSYIPFTPTVSNPTDSFLLGRNSTTDEMVIIDPNNLIPPDEEGLQKVGETYDEDTWTDLSDFIVNTAGATIVSNKINIPDGGVTDFTKSLQLAPYSCVNHWKIEIEFSLTVPISGSTTGISIGIQSTNANSACSIATYFSTSTTNTGRMELFAQANSANPLTGWTSRGSASSNLTFAEDDIIKFSMERLNNHLYMRAENLSQAVASVYYEEIMPLDNIFIIPPNTGHFAIFSQGGNFTINRWTVWNNEVQNPEIMFLGDSKTLGYGANSFYNTYPGIVGNRYNNISISAGFGDKTADLLNHIDEIIAINPNQVILSIGSNDLRFGVSNATFQANYTSIVNQLTTAGIEVIHLSPTYESVQDNSGQAIWISTTFAPYINIYRQTSLPGGLYTDGIHWSVITDREVANIVISSNLLKGIKTDQEYIEIPGTGDFVENQSAAPQPAAFYINQPSKIEYLTDTTGITPGALEVYRTTVNPSQKAFQNVRSVLKLRNTEAGHEDKEPTSVYGGLHVDALNTATFTNATEGLIAVAGTASTLGGSGSVTLMSCFAALGGNAPTGSITVDKFCFFKVTAYDVNSNTGKVANIAGFAQPKLTLTGTTAQVQWLSGIGDVTTSGGMLGNATWPTGNWNMYDASGYTNYFSGTILASTLTDDTTSKLQVGGTTRTSKVVGGTVIGDTLSLQNYTSGTTGAVLDQYGLTVGGGTASTFTLYKATRAFIDPSGNVHGFRAEHSVSQTTAPTANALFGGFFVPTVGATNTQNWTNPVAVQGISVAPTITSGSTGTIAGVVAGTFDLNLRAAGTTITNAMGLRVYVDPLTTSPMTNLTLLGIGTSGTVTGNWALYNAENLPSYLGPNTVYINTTTDSGSGAKLQVNGSIDGTGARLTSITGPQLRVAYNTSNYIDTTVSSTGSATFNLTGTSPTFTFNQVANYAAGIVVNNNAVNFYMGSASSVTSTTLSSYLVGGSASTGIRVGIKGGAATLVANQSYGSLIVGEAPITASSSGTHALISNVVIKAPDITTGASAITNAASLTVEAAPTEGTTNSAILVSAGDTRIQNLFATAPTYSSGGFVDLVRNSTTGRIESMTAVTQTLATVTTAGNTTSNSITINGLTNNSITTLNGSLHPQLNSVTTGTTLDNTMVTVVADTASGACTITLPTGVAERMYFIRRSSAANTLTVQTSGGDTFDGAAGPTSVAVTNAIIIQLQGTVWWTLAQF
jgi:hypothetical protein